MSDNNDEREYDGRDISEIVCHEGSNEIIIHLGTQFQIRLSTEGRNALRSALQNPLPHQNECSHEWDISSRKEHTAPEAFMSRRTIWIRTCKKCDKEEETMRFTTETTTTETPVFAEE